MQFDTGGILIIVFIVAIIVGLIFFKKWRKGEKLSFNIGGWFSGNHKDKEDNCFNIYSDYVEFAYIDEDDCQGVPWEFINEHKSYYVHEEKDGKLVKYVLPDVDENTQHFDPIETKNALKMYKT